MLPSRSFFSLLFFHTITELYFNSLNACGSYREIQQSAKGGIGEKRGPRSIDRAFFQKGRLL